MSESIRFCGMHHTVRMFGRRVNSEQFQSFIASVSEIMFRSGWHRKHIARANIMRFPSHEGLSRTFNKNQNLVNTFVISRPMSSPGRMLIKTTCECLFVNRTFRKLLFFKANCWTFLYCITLDRLSFNASV
jgi:hypothetical protein